MNERQLQLPQQMRVRRVLRIGGVIIAGIGLLFLLVGMVNFFMSFGTFEPPRFFWCEFVGMPLLFVGGVMCLYGFLGSMQRYVVGETAPVAADAVNYIGTNTQPGMKAVASAITEGVLDAQSTRAAKSEKES